MPEIHVEEDEDTSIPMYDLYHSVACDTQDYHRTFKYFREVPALRCPRTRHYHVNEDSIFMQEPVVNFG